MRRTLIGELDALETLEKDPFDFSNLDEDHDMTPEEEAMAISLSERCAAFETWLLNHAMPACPFLDPNSPQDFTICFPDDLSELSLEKAATVFQPFDSRLLVALVPLAACPDRGDLTRWVSDQNENHFGMWMTAFHPDRLANLGLPPFEPDTIIFLIQDLEALALATRTLQDKDPDFYAENGHTTTERFITICDAHTRSHALAKWRVLSADGPMTLFSRLHDGTADYLVNKRSN